MLVETVLVGKYRRERQAALPYRDIVTLQRLVVQGRAAATTTKGIEEQGRCDWNLIRRHYSKVLARPRSASGLRYVKAMPFLKQKLFVPIRF